MSGNDRIPSINRDVVIMQIGEFTVHPARFYSEEIMSHVAGYAIVWDDDKVIQSYSNNIMGALQFAGQSQQTLEMARALIEQATAEDVTDGLMSEPGLNDETFH